MATTTANCTKCSWQDYNCRPIDRCPICLALVIFEWDYDIDEGDLTDENEDD